MVEIFKTNVEEPAQANKIIDLLLEHFPGNRINFDLHDCDKILRVEGNDLMPEKIVNIVMGKGFQCDILE